MPFPHLREVVANVHRSNFIPGEYDAPKQNQMLILEEASAFLRRRRREIGWPAISLVLREYLTLPVVDASLGNLLLGAQRAENIPRRICILISERSRAVRTYDFGQRGHVLHFRDAEDVGVVADECRASHQQRQTARGHDHERQLTADG